MKPILIYFQMERKRMLQSFPGIILGSMLLISLLAGTFWLCHQSTQTPAHKNTVSVGIVAREGEPFIDWMIDAVSQMKNTKYTCRFLRLTEKEAENQMEQGKINVIFLIPRDYIASIIRGENKHVIIRFSQGETTIVSFLLRELCTAASSFILNSEAGIYTMQDYYREHRLPHASEDELSLNLSYIKEIAGLERGVKLEEVDIPSSYSQSSQFLASGIVLFFFLWGIAYGNLLTSQNHAFQQKLRLFSVGYPLQVILRNLAFFLVNVLSFAFLVALGYILCRWRGLSLSDTLLSQPEHLWLFGASLLPVLWLATAFIQWIYEVTEDKFGGAVFLFFSTLLLALLSGCFYPLDYLPLSIQKLARILPLYHGVEYAVGCLYRDFTPTHLIWTVGYGTTFLSITILWRSLRISRRT